MFEKIAGWEKVFGFTLKQTIKSKGYIISTLILAAVCLALVPLTSDGEMSSMEDSLMGDPIEKIYVYDEIGIPEKVLKEEFLKINDTYKDSKFEYINPESKDIEEVFEGKEDCNTTVAMHVSLEEDGINLEIIRTKDSDVGDMAAGIFGEEMQVAYSNCLYTQAGITDEQVEFLQNGVDVKLNEVVNGQLKDQQKDKTDNFMVNSPIALGIFMILIIILATGGENTSSSMVNEKASRVIEYVLTSVRPLALILGKVLACIVAQLAQVVVIIVASLGGAYIFTHGSTKITEVSQIVENMGLSQVKEEISAAGIVLGLLIIVGGIVLYLTLAALIGSTASKIEELAQTNMIYSMILLVGAYSAMILTIANFEQGSKVIDFLLIFPLSAPFVTPVFLIAGDCSIVVGIISLAVMFVTILVLILIVAKIFEAVIMYNGSRVTFKKMLEFAGLGKKRKMQKEGK